jgi:hypothetical protein
MLNHPTYERLVQLRLSGMAKALAEQAQTPDIQALTFEPKQSSWNLLLVA